MKKFKPFNMVDYARRVCFGPNYIPDPTDLPTPYDDEYYDKGEEEYDDLDELIDEENRYEKKYNKEG